MRERKRRARDHRGVLIIEYPLQPHHAFSTLDFGQHGIADADRGLEIGDLVPQPHFTLIARVVTEIDICADRVSR